LFGYEVREYLLEKFGRKCVYCGKENVPLQVEHIVPKTRGGTDRVSNLTLACEPCNQKKGNQTAEEFGYPKVQSIASKPKDDGKADIFLKDAAAVNTTRWALYRHIQETGLPIEVGTGGRTKYNRSIRGLPKTHWLDAACEKPLRPSASLRAGASTPEELKVEGMRPLVITAMGRGNRQMCRVDKYGFPRTSAKKFKRVYGFQTGDMVKAIVPRGRNTGTYIGRVAIRATGHFNVKTPSSTVQGISYRYCQMLHRTDGYTYESETAFLPF